MNQFIEARGAAYYEIDGENYSTLKYLAKSPAHYLEAKANAKKPTPAMALGTAVHTAILEPERFAAEYALWEGDVRRGKEWEAFKLLHTGKTIVRKVDLASAFAMRDAVRSHARALHYLRRGKPEVSMVWDDDVTGIACKGRVDWIAPEHTVVGIKTTRDASPASFARDAARLGYHMQWAFYADGYAAITGHVPVMVEIAIETEPPHDVVVYRIPDETLQVGREQYRDLLRMLAQCVERDEWPGQATDEIELVLPTWALRTRNEPESIEITIGGEAIGF